MLHIKLAHCDVELNIRNVINLSLEESFKDHSVSMCIIRKFEATKKFDVAFIMLTSIFLK